MPITFDNVLLDVTYSAVAQGGPTFLTDIVESPQSGVRQRNVSRYDYISRWSISFGSRTAAQLRDLYTFYVCRFGRARGFRFRDAVFNTATAQPIVTTNGVTYLAYRFTSGGVTYDKPILTPVAGATLTSGSLSTTNGISVVTGATLPATWTGTFDLPAAFDSDAFGAQVDTGAISDWGIGITELLPSELGVYV